MLIETLIEPTRIHADSIATGVAIFKPVSPCVLHDNRYPYILLYSVISDLQYHIILYYTLYSSILSYLMCLAVNIVLSNCNMLHIQQYSCVCMCIYCVYIYISIQTVTYTYICIYVYKGVHTCTCVYGCIHLSVFNIVLQL